MKPYGNDYEYNIKYIYNMTCSCHIYYVSIEKNARE